MELMLPRNRLHCYPDQLTKILKLQDEVILWHHYLVFIYTKHDLSRKHILTRIVMVKHCKSHM